MNAQKLSLISKGVDPDADVLKSFTANNPNANPRASMIDHAASFAKNANPKNDLNDQARKNSFGFNLF